MDRLKYFVQKLNVWLWIGKEVEFAQPGYALNVYQRATKAQEILENPLYIEIIENLEDDAIKFWRNTANNSQEIREHYWLYIKILDQIDSHIKGILNAAEVEKAQLEFNQKGRID